MATPPDRQPIYRPRGLDPLRTLFRRRLPDFQAAYEPRYASPGAGLYAAKYGRFRLPLIVRAASAFRPFSCKKDREVDALCSRMAWARLLAKVHELDVMACPRCGGRMSVIAVIVDPAQIRKIIACLDRHSRGPPPFGYCSTPPLD